MQQSSRKNPPNTRGRPFKKGNPGRPLGFRNKATLAAEVLLDGETEKLTRKAIELAMAGDTVALRLCLNRIPAQGTGLSDLCFQRRHAEMRSPILCGTFWMVASGEMTLSEAQSVAAVVEGWRRAKEVGEMEDRLYALECAV